MGGAWRACATTTALNGSAGCYHRRGPSLKSWHDGWVSRWNRKRGTRRCEARQPSMSRPIVEAVTEAASHCGITFLYAADCRWGTSTRLVKEAAFPAVLFGAGRDANDVLVLTGRRGTIDRRDAGERRRHSVTRLSSTPGADGSGAGRGAPRAASGRGRSRTSGAGSTARDLSPLQRTLRLLKREARRHRRGLPLCGARGPPEPDAAPVRADDRPAGAGRPVSCSRLCC